MARQELRATLTRGELSPLAYARRDLELYQAGAELLKNWIVLREGGIRRRSGTRYRGATKHANKDVRFIDFVYSVAQSYALEFGDLYIRFWTQGGQVESGGSPYEIASQYAEADLPNLAWTQANDVVFIALQSMTVPPQKLTRVAATNWTLSDVNFRDGPYLPINDQYNKVTTSDVLTTGASVTVTFQNTLNVNGGAGLQSTDVGRHIRMQFSGKWSWGKITAVSSTTTCTVLIEEGNGGGGGGTNNGLSLGGAFTTSSTTDSTGANLGSGNLNNVETYSWRLGAFSDTTGYPRCVCQCFGRLFFANTPANPRYIAYSYAGAPEVFTPSAVDGTVTDAHGGAYDLIIGDEILWLQEALRLQIGTPRGVRSLGAADTEQSFGPRNVTQKLEEQEGVAAVRPVIVGPSTVHCSRFAKAINDLFFDYQVNSLVRPELSLVAEHLFDEGVKELIFQQVPHRRLWIVMENGDLRCTTLDRYEKVVGFTRHDIGGEVVSACAIPGSDGYDEVWFAVRRTINGNTVQYVETLEPDFIRGDVEDAWFSDCGGVYTGAATNTISGVTWLANEEVSILADGRVLPNATVSSGGVLTLPNNKTAEKVIFGLPIEARGRVLRTPILTATGSSLGRKTRVVTVDVDVYETKGLRIESDMGSSDPLIERPAGKETATYLQSGVFRIDGDGSWRSEGQFDFVADTPLPVTIRAFNITLDTEP